MALYIRKSNIVTIRIVTILLLRVIDQYRYDRHKFEKIRMCVQIIYIN